MTWQYTIIKGTWILIKEKKVENVQQNKRLAKSKSTAIRQSTHQSEKEKQYKTITH